MSGTKRFDEKIMDNIKGPKKIRVPITFPEPVLNEFRLFARQNSADCYWLAIKTLLNFYKDQTEGDVKTILMMKFIEDTNKRIDEVYSMVTSLSTPKKDKFQTFGKPIEEDK